MIDAVKAGKRALEIFESGVCCSEAVVYAIAETKELGNAILYTKMSSGLCGGMGLELACGVLTGGACAIGLYLGRNSLEEVPAVKCSTISKHLAAAFTEHYSA